MFSFRHSDLVHRWNHISVIRSSIPSLLQIWRLEKHILYPFHQWKYWQISMQTGATWPKRLTSKGFGPPSITPDRPKSLSIDRTLSLILIYEMFRIYTFRLSLSRFMVINLVYKPTKASGRYPSSSNSINQSMQKMLHFICCVRGTNRWDNQTSMSPKHFHMSQVYHWSSCSFL